MFQALIRSKSLTETSLPTFHLFICILITFDRTIVKLAKVV